MYSLAVSSYTYQRLGLELEPNKTDMYRLGKIVHLQKRGPIRGTDALTSAPQIGICKRIRLSIQCCVIGKGVYMVVMDVTTRPDPLLSHLSSNSIGAA